jgi:poly-gamma-glutamate capsule biosynthesis protein CapA/YwtB (metallophosphatase superfamily)
VTLTPPDSQNDVPTDVEICAVGDVLVKQKDPFAAFEHVGSILSGSDICFGNCEAVYSSTDERNPVAEDYFICPPDSIAALAKAGFDVMSVANNHVLDGGYSGFLDTIKGLNSAQIEVAGGGIDLAAARTASFQNVRGKKVAFVAFTCHVPPGFGARANRPGCSVVKVHTAVELKQPHPGEVSKIRTFVSPEDSDDFCKIIRDARMNADVVIVSMHWGLGQSRSTISDYERLLGRLAIESGAGAVFGHGQHIMKGIESYAGRPIIYGLGNFVFNFISQKEPQSPPPLDPSKRTVWAFPFGDECRRSMIALLSLKPDGSILLRLRPILINLSGQPVPLHSEDPEFPDYVAYLTEITDMAGFNVKYRQIGNEVFVEL